MFARRLVTRSLPALRPQQRPFSAAAATKVDPVKAFEHIQSLGVNTFFGVPDSLLAPFCQVVTEKAERHLITANEGSAVATAAGHHFATGEVPLVYLQNSGLGNTINPILSLAHADVYGTPMVVMIGWRGAPGTKDEPQHVVQGRLTEDMVQGMGIQTFTLPAEGDAAAHAVITEAVAAAKAAQQPVALLVPPKTFSGSKNMPDAAEGTQNRPTREQALEQIMTHAVQNGDAVVSTTGYCSREVYEIREKLGQSHDADFLTVGSMGHSVAIAHGIAMAQPERTVWCLDGDGASLMHMGNMAISGATKMANLRHVVLNNEVHDSVGAQPTAAAKGTIDFSALAEAVGYSVVPMVETPEGLAAAGATLKAGANGGKPSFLEVKLKLGVRGDLGRPKTTTQEAKTNFMSYLSK